MDKKGVQTWGLLGVVVAKATHNNTTNDQYHQSWMHA